MTTEMVRILFPTPNSFGFLLHGSGILSSGTRMMGADDLPLNDLEHIDESLNEMMRQMQDRGQDQLQPVQFSIAGARIASLPADLHH
jgi:hypothetical protein